MKKIIFLSTVLVAFTTMTAFAGDGHGHGGHDGHGHDQEIRLNRVEITERASMYVTGLVEKGKLDASWKGISPEEVKEHDAHEWVVTFSNPMMEDPEKQTLYMFLSQSGRYIAANFTGH